MPLLRLTQHAESATTYKVQVELDGDGLPRQTASATVSIDISPQDRADVRWYLEDYLQNPHDPAPKIAAGIEKKLDTIGADLFADIFHADDDARELWTLLKANLARTRVEIVAPVEEATAIPWELIRDPKTNTALALHAQAFVRAQPQAAFRPRPAQTTPGEPIRILLAICRPGQREDVPFRSVANRLIKSLSGSDLFQLDVLRPPTFNQLGKVLRAASAAGKPYHVVHFDGHGAYVDGGTIGDMDMRDLLSPHIYAGLREGKHGYLIFENVAMPNNVELVNGQDLGDLLYETGVPVLVLNACRSAFADAPEKPESASGDADVHTQVRAFGSLAQEIMGKGAAGVVAMRYNVYVVTAAQFVADLYAAMTQGHTLGEAVTLGRKQLAADPSRSIAYAPLPLQDWSVPIVYEAAPIRLFPQPAAEKTLNITINAGEAAPAVRGSGTENLPRQPDAGFFGRDETLLALDRAFDTQPVVLLWAYAGSGKTTTAAEFARWYSLTGGVRGPVLFTSFEQYKPLPRVLDDFGRVFAPALEGANVQWLALDDADRRSVALQVMRQIPLLWIWDNVEPVNGFPAGTPSAWSADEQRELADFLRDARDTQAKFLLTSRRDEDKWLGDLPRRIPIPRMPMQERVQLAKALAEKHGRQITDVDDWRPLLAFTQGNPLTITVLVGQALRNGLKTRAQIETFVAQLRAGEAAFDDEETEGRGKSLGASLAYGFEHAFTDAERKILALLHFFQGFVDVDALRFMGDAEIIGEHALPEVRDLTRETGIALLDRAAEVGLLTAFGYGYYSIHPALPWYFHNLFRQYYPDDSPPLHAMERGLGGEDATRAFVEAMGSLGNYYHDQYEVGNRDVIAALSAEEDNLLYARRLARANGWWPRIISTMQGLNQLYDHTGRRAEWQRLVEEIVPDFVDPTNDGPLRGLEEQWNFITAYRVRLAREARQWVEAERLQRIRVDWNRQRTASALTLPPEALDTAGRNVIRSLAVSVSELGNILREQGKADCVMAYEEDYELSLSIDDKPGAAVTAFNLGRAYTDIPAIRNLTEAERWYKRDLELEDPRDNLGRAKVIGQLGLITYERFEEARKANKPESEQRQHLNDALRLYRQALDLFPKDAVNELAISHNQLGIIYNDAGDLDHALLHFSESIRYKEVAGSVYSAADTRLNVAITLRGVSRFLEAREYALAALGNYSEFGDRAADKIQKTQALLAQIDREAGLQAGDTVALDAQIQQLEAAGDKRQAAIIAYNAAIGLAKKEQFDKALYYAQVSLRGFESLDARGSSDAEDSRKLIANIQRDAALKQGDTTALDAQIQQLEAAGETHDAAVVAYNASLQLARGGQFAAALKYAEKSLHAFESLGESGTSDAEDSRKLIAAIEQAMNQQGGG